LLTADVALPTNSWYENLVLGDSLADVTTSRVFTIPFVMDTAGPTRGIRSHASGVKAEATTVEQVWNPLYGLTLGAVEATKSQTVFDNGGQGHGLGGQGSGAPKQLGIELSWSGEASYMSCPVVRGCPYTTMTYHGLTPKLVAEVVPLNGQIVVDGIEESPVQCASLGPNEHDMTLPQPSSSPTTTSNNSFTVNKEMKFTLRDSDMTWLVFVSQPTKFRCDFRDHLGVPYQLALPFFRIVAEKPFLNGGIRIAMANNCSTAKSDPTFCNKKDGSPFTPPAVVRE
jgi:hypothetical protein